jgi:WD40 repeat protein
VIAVPSGRQIASASLSPWQLLAVAVDSSGQVFVADGQAQVHEFDPQLRGSTVLHETPCDLPARRIAASATGGTVVVSTDGAASPSCLYEADRNATGWQIDALYPPQTSPVVAAYAAAITPNASAAVVGFSDGRLTVWRPGSMQPVANYHDFGGEVRGAAFSPDGSRLLVATADGIVSTLPTCTFCGTTAELATQVDTLLRHATELGLYQP